MDRQDLTFEELQEECPEAILIGNEDRRADYFPAIIAVDFNDQRVVYDRAALVRCFMEKDGMTEEEAVEWVSYNVDRYLPYLGEHAPAIADCVSVRPGSTQDIGDIQ